MKIRLKEIPPEGREYVFDRKSGELTADLEDLIGRHPYDVRLFIKPIGNAYEMRGRVHTHLTEVCSKCGWDFELPIDKAVNEILFEDQDDEHRKTQAVHGNQSVDFLAEGPSMTPVRGEVFDAGSYAHEIIAVTEPAYPMCGPNQTCLHEDEVNRLLNQLENEFALADEKRGAHPAFEVLNSLKKN